MNQRNMFYKRGLASLVITTGVWLSPSPLWATPITFSFGGITDNTENTFKTTVGEVTMTLTNPQCVKGKANINFRTSADGLHLEPEAGTANGNCNLGSPPGRSASQFDLSFDKPVQFSSYQSKAWDAGTYELVVNGVKVSSGNTVGTNTRATTGPHAFASTPTLAANTTATFKMVPLASPSRGGDGGKLKSLTVDYKSPQTISFGALGNKTYGDAAFSLSATADSKLPVSYTATGTCTVSGQTVTLTGAGECSIVANQAGNGSYTAATTVTQTFKIAQATQTLEFKPVTKGTVGQSATLSATASSGLTELTFSSTPTSVCTVNGTQVSFKDAGTCAVTAKQAGNSNYLPVTASGKILVAAAPQMIKSDKTVTVNDPAFQVKASSNADLPVELTLDPQSVGICELNGDTVTPVSAGMCLINAFQAGNATTNPAQAVYQFEITEGQIEPQEQNLSVQFSPATGIVGDVLNISATPGESGNAVTLASSTAETCSVQGSSVTLLKEGVCTVTATQQGNTHYLEASASSSVTVKTNKATFNLTVSSNKDNSGELTQVSQADTVNIALKVTAAPKDVGKTAELFLTAQLGNDPYILTHEGWQPWDGVTWTSVTQQTLTDEAITIPAFSGQFPASGTFEFTAAYRLTGSSAISQGPQAVGNLTVTAFNPVEQAKTDCLGKGGIYYAQQCFTDVKDLGNGFAGGIYVEGQASLQTNANLACRLGKKVAVLGRFNVSDEDVGQPAEVVFAFQDNLDNVTGKTIGALPKIYSAALFEGELPTTGTLPVSFGYRLLNSEGSKGVLKSATGLTFAVPVDSCDNPDLQLVTSPLGTGTGEVLTKTAEDGSVRLVAIPATDGSAFAGWTGDAEGCNSKEAIVTIKPTADKFTCQPTFNNQVLGTWNCVNGQDPEYGACCDLNDSKCPAFPTTCKTSVNDDEQWFYVITSKNYVNQLFLSNAGTAAVDAQFSAYANGNGNSPAILENGGKVLDAWGKVTVKPQTTLRASIPNIVSFDTSVPSGVLRFTGKGLTAAAWAVKIMSPSDVSPLMQLSAIPRVVIMPGIAQGEVTDFLILLNSKNLATGGKTVEARLRYVLKDETLMTAANIKQSTVTLKPGVMNSLKLDDLITVPVVAPLLNKIEVIHPDPAQRCTGEALTAFRRTNAKSGNWIGYGGR